MDVAFRVTKQKRTVAAISLFCSFRVLFKGLLTYVHTYIYCEHNRNTDADTHL